MHYSRRPSFRILQSAFRIALVALGAAGAATAVAQEVVYLKANATGDGSGTSWENACTTLADAVTAAAGQKPIYAARGWYQGAPTVTMVDGTVLYGGFRGDETGTTNAIFAARDPAANPTVFARVAPTALYWRHAVPGDNAVTYSNIAAATHPVFTVDADGVPAFNPPPAPEGEYDGYVIGGQSTYWKLFAITQNNGSTIDGIWSVNGYALVDSLNTGAPRRIRNCRFYGCSGGAVLGNNQNIEHNNDKESVRVEDCEFRYSTSMQVRPYGGHMIVDRCLFTDHFRTGIGDSGGVIWAWYRKVTVRNCIFTRCVATSSSTEGDVNYCPANCISRNQGNYIGVENCVFTNNLSMSTGGYGLPLLTPRESMVRGCLIARNRLETRAIAGRRYALVTGALRAGSTCAYEGCTFVSNSVAATVSEAGTFAVGILCNAPTGKMGVYNCAFVDNDVTCEDDGVSTPVLSQGVIFSEAEATTAGARATVVNCAFIRSAEDPDIRDVVQIGLHTADFHVINSVFTRGPRAQYNPFYASFPAKFHVRFCSVGGLTVRPDWLDIEEGWQTDAVPMARVTDAATGRISYRPLCKMPALRECAEVVTNAITANVIEPDRAPYYVNYKVRLSPDGAWFSPLGDTLAKTYENLGFADAFDASRPVAGAATRGPVQALPAAAETGRTLLVRSDPYGAGLYTPDYWQVVQPGDAMTPVSAVSADPTVATFSHWEDASGTTLAGATLDLGVLTDDITIAKVVFTVPQVSIVLDLGVYGVFTADGTTRKELTLPVDSAFPLYAVGNASDYVFVGWQPALPERVPAASTTYRGYGVTKDLRIVYLAPADDPVAANGAGDGTSWANAYRGDFIAAYRDAGTWRGEVWVKRGVYDASRSLDLLSNVHVRGGFAGTETDASQADPVANPVIYTGDANHDNRYNVGDAKGTDTGVAVIDYENLAYNLPSPASRLTYWSATRNVSDGISIAFTAVTAITNSVVEGLIVTGFKDKAANISPIAHVGWRKCIFIGNNTAVNANQAGAAFANYGACEFEDCDFIAMHTPLAILDNDTTQTDSNRLVRCRFRFNHGNASGTGGGFNVSNARRDIILDDCEFADTYIWEYQGYQRCPVQIDTCKNFVMRDCRILRNTYKNRCVAAFDIEAVGGNLTIERCVFRDNQKYGHGTDSGKTAAALRLNGLKFANANRHVIRDTLFEGNSVVHQESCNGAMQAVRQASALSHFRGLLEVVNCTFVSNYVDTAGAATDTYGATVHAARNDTLGYAIFANCLFKDNEVKGYSTCDVMCHSAATNTPVVFVNTVFTGKAAGYQPLFFHPNGFVTFRALNCAIQGYAPGAYPSAQWGWDIGNTAADATPDRRIARGPNGAYAIRAKASWAAKAGRPLHEDADGFLYVPMPEVNDAKPYFKLAASSTQSTWWQAAVSGMTEGNEADLRVRDAFGSPPRNRGGIPSLGPVNFVEGATILTLR
ncbi:MAG: right-handed parallel beta-helix repeat-containing protein [Kiritimatiellae bacterium]|nr:right-handed parallel beta-helix repeat-containing protein [Kiritimatiellia bacterium]